MYSTTVYLFQQIARVVLLDTSGQYFTLRYDPVYAKTLTINKGVDNVLLFAFVNQDEKPVNITGSTLTFRCINQQGTQLLLELPMVILNGPAGQAKVTIPASALYEVIAQPASYSISIASGILNQAVFTDAQSGARAPVNIVNSVQPYFVPSTPLTIPTTQLASQVSVDGTPYENYPDWSGQFGSPGAMNYYYTNTEFYTSFISPRGPLTTIQMTLDQYTGTIKAQWAADYESIWHNITESTTYYAEDKTITMNIHGWYPLLRLCFNNNIWATPTPPGNAASAYAVCVEGVLTDVVIQNGGSGYLAPPKINVVGDGSGAECVAVMSNTYPPGHPQAGLGYGSVVAINVVRGGSGYWPIPAGGVNSAQFPVPPANQGAAIAITTGYVVDLFYR